MPEGIKSTSVNSVHGLPVLNPDGTNIGDSLPTNSNNPSLVLGYTGANLTTVTKTIGGVQYQKTLSYTGDNLTGVSSWTQL